MRRPLLPVTVFMVIRPPSRIAALLGSASLGNNEHLNGDYAGS